MNLNKEFNNVLTGGKPYKRSFPQTEEDAKLPETLKNVLINVLSIASVRDRRETFYVNHIAAEIHKCETPEEFVLREPYLKFLKDACYEAIQQEDPKTGETRGVYMSHLMSQVLEELGEKPDIN